MDFEQWEIDWDLETADPKDGGPLIDFCWQGMGPVESLKLVQEAYRRGFEKGRSNG